MSETKKGSFPSIPEKNWWTLRKKFTQTIPAAVTDSYVSSVLSNMTRDSARANVINPLKAVGLVDETGKPTELARRWRNDEQYGDVCNTIRREVYPQELLDAFSEPTSDPTGVRNWFMHYTGLGADAARKMASFYLLLCDADASRQNAPTQPPKTTNAVPVSRKSQARTRPEGKPGKQGESRTEVDLRERQNTSDSARSLPSLHLDIQIHISPDASAEQIEHIFASMSRHLYHNG